MTIFSSVGSRNEEYFIGVLSEDSPNIHFKAITTLFYEAFESNERGVLKKELKNLQHTTLYLKKRETSSRILGALMAKLTTEKLHVKLLAVNQQKKKYLRRGLGTQLMKKIFEIALEKRVVVSLKYDCTNYKLRQFYKRFKPKFPGSSSCDSLQKIFISGGFVKAVFDPATSLNAINEMSFNSKRSIKSIEKSSHITNVIKRMNTELLLLIFIYASVCIYASIQNCILQDNS
jgi:ribosomal protein S18 acetylase RimI-like enzyme